MKYNDIWRIIGFCALLLAGQNVLSGKERIAPGTEHGVRNGRCTESKIQQNDFRTIYRAFR